MLPSNVTAELPSGPRLHAELIADALCRRGAISLRVLGGSMWPWLRSGDVISVRREDPARIHPGDIVLFAREGRLFAHRVIRKAFCEGRAVLVTKGDALPRPDVPLSGDELLGRVVSFRRGRRRVALDTTPGRALARAATLLTGSSRFFLPLARSFKRVLPFRS